MKRFLNFYSLVCCLMLISATSAFSQIANVPEEDQEYINVLKGRSDKIVANLNIEDDAKKKKVRDLIVMQYYNLSKIHDKRDAAVEELKKQEDKKSAEKKIAKIEKKADKQLDKLHKKYIANLSKELSPEQVAGVKDGMTYGVVPITYNGYVEMLPSLTEAQKEKILNYLVEAREHAMDAGSSEKKHWWFGQYKGKINNYLSAEGYDLNQAQKDWKKRREANATKD